MHTIKIRQATLEDVNAITALHCSNTTTWRNPKTHKVTPYEELDLYARWRHGGPWMSVEMLAVHLNHLLQRGHLPLVAEIQGQVVGEAEYYLSNEAPPFKTLHLSVLYVHREWHRQGVGKVLLEAGTDYAYTAGFKTITTQPEESALQFYTKMGFRPWQQAKEMQFPAEPGPLPKSLELVTAPTYLPAPELALRIGRYQCGSQNWENLWPTLMIPHWSTLPRWVWQYTLPGSGKIQSRLNPPTAILGLREQVFDPHQVDGYAWLPLNADLAPAIRILKALAAQKGYKAVDLLLPGNQIEYLKATLEMGYQATIDLWAKEVETRA